MYVSALLYFLVWSASSHVQCALASPGFYVCYCRGLVQSHVRWQAAVYYIHHVALVCLLVLHFEIQKILSTNLFH